MVPILSFPEANALAEVAEFLGISPEFYLESSLKTILYKNKAAKGFRIEALCKAGLKQTERKGC